jgi:hypothetical protein
MFLGFLNGFGLGTIELDRFPDPPAEFIEGHPHQFDGAVAELEG